MNTATTTTATTLDEWLAAASPLAQRMYAAQEQISMVLGYEWGGARYIAEQRQALEQAIAELQAAQAELDPPGDTDAATDLDSDA